MEPPYEPLGDFPKGQLLVMFWESPSQANRGMIRLLLGISLFVSANGSLVNPPRGGWGTQLDWLLAVFVAGWTEKHEWKRPLVGLCSSGSANGR